jgi:protein-S-isoprenylcysteine O-methyltransferase Ste14
MQDSAPSMSSSSGTTSPDSSPSSDVPAPSGARALLLAYGNFIFRYRDYILPAAVVVTLACTHPRPFLGEERYSWMLDVVGILVALSGQALRVLVIGLAYIRRGGINKRIAAKQLVCTGVFAHCRHPLYAGNFLLFLGLMIIWNSPWTYVLVGLVALSLFAMASAEEEFLRGKFGAEYDDYCRRVNRFVPDLRGLRRTLAGFTFDWKRVLRKEYGTTFSWTTTAVVLVVVQHLLWNGVSASRGTVADAALVWLCLAGLWGLTRWMKKSHRLVSPD